MRRAINLNKIDMEHEILDLIDRYWKFDNDQTPVSNWHDKQDLLEAVRKVLRIHDVVGRSELLFAFIAEIKSEFADQNWDYLDFIAERVIGKQ